MNNDDTLSTLQHCNETISDYLSQEDVVTKYFKNESISLLLRLFSDKKSKKVCYAFEEIRRRFDYLSFSEQKKIILCFLDSSRTYRLFAYRKCEWFYDKSLQQPLLDCWHKYHDEECQDLLSCVLPSCVLRKIFDDISDGPGYRYLCNRFCDEPWFMIDSTKLQKYTTILEYVRIMINSKRGIGADELEELVYRYIAITIYWNRYRVYRLRQGSGCWTSYGYSLNQHPLKIGSVGLLVACMHHLGMDKQYQDFIDWDMEVYNATKGDNLNIFQENSPILLANHIDILISAITDLFPFKYSHLLYIYLDSCEINVCPDDEPLTYVKRYKHPKHHMDTLPGYGRVL